MTRRDPPLTPDTFHEDPDDLFDPDAALQAVRAAEEDAVGTTAPIKALEDTLPPSVPAHARVLPTATPEPVAPTELPEDTFETVHDPRIPAEQSFFKIGEAAEIVSVKPYVLRYWENEFSWIKPEKTSSRQRRYRRQDVALFLTIKRLRHDEQLTVAQTRDVIQEARRRGTGRPRSLFPSSAPPRALPDLSPVTRRLSERRQEVLALLEAVED